LKSALNKHLTHRDLVELLTLSHCSLACKNHADLEGLVLNLKGLLSFQNALCARGNVTELLQTDLISGSEPNIDVIDISYPAGYLDEYLANQYYSTDAIFCDFITTLSPVNWASVDKKYQCQYPAQEFSLDFNIKDGWTHGTLDPTSMDCHVFFLGGPVVENNLRAKTIIDYIIPFYAEAYQRILRKPVQTARLTQREIEVLNWIKEGKSSWEISMILKCSKSNIEFHIANIKGKLNAANRTQAVVIALQQGLIRF
jgi:DNA-binding CsgD family transcriptional regulator